MILGIRSVCSAAAQQMFSDGWIGDITGIVFAGAVPRLFFQL